MSQQDFKKLSAEQRCQIIKAPLWVPYGVADTILADLNDLRTYEVGSDPPGMTLWGYKGAGKTSILKRFRASVIEDLGFEKDRSQIPILYVVTPSEPRVDALYMSILRAARSPIAQGIKTKDKNILRSAVLNSLIQMRVQVIVFDEIHTFMTGRQPAIELLVNTLTTLADELTEQQSMNKDQEQVTATGWVLCGTQDALDVINYSDSFHRRFTPRELPLWDLEVEEDLLDMAQFLADLEASLYLNKKSKLGDSTFVEFFFEKCGGYRGNLVHLVQQSTLYALRAGKEQLTQKLINEYIKKHRWVPKSKLS